MHGAGSCNNITDADVGLYRGLHVSKTCLSRMETLQANIDRPSIESRNWHTQMVAKFYCLESIEHLGV